MAQYRDLNDFLRKHKTTEKDGITHTRIGDGNEILPGKFIINDTELGLFYKLYHKHVFVEKHPEYLTEKQLENNCSQMLVDLDFRYSSDIKERQHSDEHIEDIIQIYIETIHKYLNIEKEISINVYVLEKPNVNLSNEKMTKDGVHLVFNIALDHILQCIIRDDVLIKIKDVLDDLNLINDYENVLDDGISKGYTNWQMYGSRKPGNEAYEITNIYNVELDDEGEINMEKQDLDDINRLEILDKISARFKLAQKYNIRDEFKELYEERKQSKSKKNKTTKTTHKMKFTQEGFNFDVSEIRNQEILQGIVEKMLGQLSSDEYLIKEAHNYLMCLPSKYYNNFNEWIRCGWALHNTDFRLFLSWMLFSSQSEKFNYDDIPGYYQEWVNMKDEGFSSFSLIYWAKESNPEGYNAIRKETTDYYITLCENSGTDWDVANVVYHYYKDVYRCSSIKYKSWYKYVNNRWEEMDSASSLRYNISKHISRLFSEKSSYYIEKSNSLKEEKPEESDKIYETANKLSALSLNLKKTSFKQNIMKEAGDAFYEADPKFYENLDKNPYLLCFKNGVIDFKEKVFRQGKPEDYISMSTHIKYIPYEKLNSKQLEYAEEIRDFMNQLFPVKELNKYMWEHLASVLIGKNVNQTFNIYNGSGSNGKSKLVDLMSLCLGDYKGVVPVALVTEKRGGVGSLSSEIATLRGVRYAVMQEPSKGDKLNEGIMKELTGEDPIMANPKYKDPITFIPQFSLVVCTNTLFEIKSSEDGTWRRIRLCEFMSKFRNEPEPDEENPYQYKIDPNISEKFENWKEVFMSMLVKIAFETDGIVKDCDMVLAASNEYRKGQDYLMEFKTDKIEKSNDPHAKIKKTEVYAEFQNWYKETYGKNIPKGKELYDFLDKKLGKYKSGWSGYKIKYDVEQEAEPEFNDDY
jgi:P4 family phage/plasmid primase-like protien